MLFVLQKKFYIPFSFILPNLKTELRFFLAIFRGEGKVLFLCFKWHFSNPEKQTSVIMKSSIFTL